MIHETKLGNENPTLFIPGYDTRCLNRSFRGTRNHRGGDLINHIHHGVLYSLATPINSNLEEMQKIFILTARRSQVSLTNMYVPPASSSFSGPPNSHTIWFYTTRGLICGDFNAHHVSWDDFVEADPREQAVYDWLEDNDRILLNEGFPTH